MALARGWRTGIANILRFVGEVREHEFFLWESEPPLGEGTSPRRAISLRRANLPTETEPPLGERILPLGEGTSSGRANLLSETEPPLGDGTSSRRTNPSSRIEGTSSGRTNPSSRRATSLRRANLPSESEPPLGERTSPRRANLLSENESFLWKNEPPLGERILPLGERTSSRGRGKRPLWERERSSRGEGNLLWESASSSGRGTLNSCKNPNHSPILKYPHEQYYRRERRAGTRGLP
jgi:hypothetical protein